jgi:hypothetical protein
MLDVLTEQELPKFVREMVKGRDDVTIAVAFWGKEAETLLGLEKAIGGRILCNPQLGYCDEKLINQLKSRREGCASACASAPPDRSRRTGQTTSNPARKCDNMLS